MNRQINIAHVQPLDKPVETSVVVPGSKSYSLRALLISALCDQSFKIQNLLASDDVHSMQSCLEAIRTKEGGLEAGDSGLTARFMIALACVSDGSQTINGSEALKKRPVKDLVNALRQLGADISYINKDGYLPLKVSSSELEGGKVSLSGSISSQYLSALLLIGPVLKNGLVIEVSDRQISKPYIDMTTNIMAYFGVEVENDNYQKYTVKPQKYQAKNYEVEGDYSSAAYFYAINALTGSNLKVENLNPQSKQGDKKFVDLLQNGQPLPKEIDAADFPDQAMTLAVLAAFSEGKTVINGVASLRVKETERVVAMENELAKMGIKTTSTNDSLTIYGGKPNAATIDTYNDHRIAMSFAVAATKLPGIKIIDPLTVGKTFPGFWDQLGKITNVKFEAKAFSNILLIGMRGSGKSIIGKALAEELNKEFVDTDQYLEAKYGQTVRAIVISKGWDYFRDIESAACQELAKKTNCVIASGGGIILKADNMEAFASNSLVVLLKADPKILSERIKNDQNRPELSGQPTLLGELDQVWEERKAKYYANADFIINSGDASLKQLVNEIMRKL